MLEELKKQRDVYAAEAEKVEAEDISLIVEERFQKVRDEIIAEVKKEHEEKVAEAKLKVEHYDFVIKHLEEIEKPNDSVPSETEESAVNIY